MKSPVAMYWSASCTAVRNIFALRPLRIFTLASPSSNSSRPFGAARRTQA